MKQLIVIPFLLIPMLLLGQTISRQELKATNDLIRGAMIYNLDGVGTNLTVHGIRSSDGTPGADAITGGVTFKDGFYTGGEIFGTNWVTNAVSAIFSNSVVKGTNINALDFRNGPDIISQVSSGAVQAVSITNLVINTTGSGGLVRSNAPNLHAPTLDGTNFTAQVDAQIAAVAAPLLQSATNYANGVTNSSIMRQTQATSLSNALVTLAYSIGTDATNFTLAASNAVRLVTGLASTNQAIAILQSATNYANSITNSTLVTQPQATALSNALVALAYTIGSNGTNYTLTASNNVRLVAGLDATNLSAAILQASTNYTLTASNNVRLVAGLASTNQAIAILQSATNYANSITNTTLVTQSQATALSNAVVALAFTIGANDTNFTLTASNNVRLVAGLASTNLSAAILQAATNYANGVTNSSIARQTQLTALSNALITFAYMIGANDTNFTLTASNNVRLVAGLASTNAIVTASNNVRLVAGLAATNHAAAVLASSTNYTDAAILAKLIASNGVWVASQGGKATNLTVRGVTMPTLTASRALVLNSSGNPTNATGTADATHYLDGTGAYSVPVGGGGSGIATNANQFGASVTLTLKDGVQVTNETVAGTLDVVPQTPGSSPTAISWANTNNDGLAVTLQSSRVYSNLTLIWPTNGFGGITDPVPYVIPESITGTGGSYTGQLGWVSASSFGGSTQVWTNDGSGSISELAPALSTTMTNPLAYYQNGALMFSAGYYNPSTTNGFTLYDDKTIARFAAEQSGTNSGTTVIVDSLGSSRFQADQDGISGGDTRIYDSSGTIRFVARQNGQASGDVELIDANGNTRFEADQDGNYAGATYIVDAFNTQRFYASQDGAGGGDTVLSDAGENARITIHTNSVEITGPTTNSAGFVINGWLATSVSTLSGLGGANTNFTVNLSGDNDIFLDGGTTNVNLRAMNWASGLAKTVNLVITNRTATVRTLSFDAITNNWLGMGTITGPISVTNGLYLSIKSMGGTNVWYGAQYTALPTQ